MKQNHLRGCGTTALRARVLSEVESLETTAAGLLKHQDLKTSRKRPSFDSPQGGRRKQLKLSQIEVEIPDILQGDTEVFRGDTDPIDTLPAVRTQSSVVVLRARQAMECRWSSGGQKGFYDSEGVKDSDDSEDSEDDEDSEDSEDDEGNGSDKDESDEDHEDDGGDEKDKDNKNEESDEDNRLGFSAWDSFEEDFEREAALIGLSSLWKLLPS